MSDDARPDGSLAAELRALATENRLHAQEWGRQAAQHVHTKHAPSAVLWSRSAARCAANFGRAALLLEAAAARLDLLESIAALRPPMTRIYCPQCGTSQPLRGDEPRLDPPSPEGDPDALWGDLCCGVCSVVVATVEYERVER